jgi:L-alanine-DL-glutamate epimerase-like enolase superfamily enzyme
MQVNRRAFLRGALGIPAAATIAQFLGPFEVLAASMRRQFKITAVKALQLSVTPGTILRIDTDAGVSGYGPAHGTGPYVREVIKEFMSNEGSAEGLSLIGKDPLAIAVHHHNMFYAWAQRFRPVRVLSGIDIALWDLAGKILNTPVSKLLGGNFRDEIVCYSHCGHTGNFWSKEEWGPRAEDLKNEPAGFKAFKVDLNDAIGVIARQYVPSLLPADIRRVALCYDLAREAFGQDYDIIVHGHNELDVASSVRVAEAVEHIKPLWFEDPLAVGFSESWMALRRSTRIPLLTGEDLELIEEARPFIEHQAVDFLQPDLLQSGGITGVKVIADLAASYRMPICLHNVSGLLLNLASQQFSAAIHNAPMMECARGSDQAPAAKSNFPVIKNGKMQVHSSPGIGADLDEDYLRAHLAPGEPWWG